MKALQLFTRDLATGEILPTGAADFAIPATGQNIAVPGAIAFILTSTGQLTPTNIELIRNRV